MCPLETSRSKRSGAARSREGNQAGGLKAK
jgi:hypothetical protein